MLPSSNGNSSSYIFRSVKLHHQVGYAIGIPHMDIYIFIIKNKYFINILKVINFQSDQLCKVHKIYMYKFRKK